MRQLAGSFAGVEALPEAVFTVRGTTVKARLSRIGIEMTAIKAIFTSCIGRDILGLCELSRR